MDVVVVDDDGFGSSSGVTLISGLPTRGEEGNIFSDIFPFSLFSLFFFFFESEEEEKLGKSREREGKKDWGYALAP
jgi:hypothetical protein